LRPTGRRSLEQHSIGKENDMSASGRPASEEHSDSSDERSREGRAAMSELRTARQRAKDAAMSGQL
jgi:hypothetical protein